MFPDPMENLSAAVSTDARQCPSSRDPRRMPNGIDVCVRIRSGPEKSAILLAKCLVSFLQIRISKMLLMKSFVLCWICNRSVAEMRTIDGILPVDYALSDADPVFRVSLHLLLRCSQTPHNSTWETKKFLDAKMIHLCTRIFYSSYADVGVAAFLNSITGGSNYLVRRSKIIFWSVGIHMFRNEGGQKYLVRDTKG
jgi:hypothetical protein